MAREAYYNRVMSADLVKWLTDEYAWLIDYVHRKNELEFQTGRDESISWFSIYRGTGRVVKFTMTEKGKKKIEATKTYRDLYPDFYKNPTKDGFDYLLGEVIKKESLNRYYKSTSGTLNEGYYQTLFGRRYTLDCKEYDDFILFDKEFQIGKVEYMNDYKKIGEWADSTILELKDELVKGKIKVPTKISNNYTECDYAGIGRNGDLYLFEVKHSGNTQGIYTSPLQIGFYEKLVSKFKESNLVALGNTIYEMLKQKQELKLIKPAWDYSTRFNGNIKLAVIEGEVSVSPTAKKGFDIAKRVIGQDIAHFTCEPDGTLKELKL